MNDFDITTQIKDKLKNTHTPWNTFVSGRMSKNNSEAYWHNDKDFWTKDMCVFINIHHWLNLDFMVRTTEWAF